MGGIAYSVTTNGYKNVAVVAGAGAGDARITVRAGNTSATGADRREMYVDARQEQPEDGGRAMPLTKLGSSRWGAEAGGADQGGEHHLHAG